MDTKEEKKEAVQGSALSLIIGLAMIGMSIYLLFL